MAATLLPTPLQVEDNNRHAESSMSRDKVVHHGPTHAEISNRAYDIYAAKGHRHGECKKNWQQAERELRQDRQSVDAKDEMQNEGGSSSPSSGLFSDSPLSVPGNAP